MGGWVGGSTQCKGEKKANSQTDRQVWCSLEGQTDVLRHCLQISIAMVPYCCGPQETQKHKHVLVFVYKVSASICEPASLD